MRHPQIYATAPSHVPTTEDGFISQFFGRGYNGYFVDIGAHDGRSYSNSRPLWEEGWSGMLIEPDPDTFKKLLENYPSKERLEFINAAICETNGPIDFYQHSDTDRTGWHSIEPSWITTWEPGKARKITVEGRRFDSLKFAKAIDLLSIDTEGYDAAILEMMPEAIRPKLVICEVDKNGIRERVEKEMDRRRYKFVWGTYLNSAYTSAQ